MGVRTKTIITAVLVLLVVGVLILQTENKGLFKGQIMSSDGVSEDDVSPGNTQTDESMAPDLKAALEVVDGEGLTVAATIENLGPGAIEGGQSFIYKLELNGLEILSNSDSYSALEAGDSFSFNYPIAKDIYNYPNEGTLKFTIDTEGSINEVDEQNNSVEISYKL